MAIPEDLKKKIDKMSQLEMARRWRFAPIGDPMFQSPAFEYFQARFRELGGMTSDISKRIGW